MKVNNMNKTQPQKPPFTGGAEMRDITIRQFRAYLHLAITACQTDRDKEFAKLPGPNSLTYCRTLAEMPGKKMAGVLACPINAVLDQMRSVARECEARSADPDPATSATAREILDQLDFALCLVLRNLTFFVKRRVAVTQCADLLSEVLCCWMIDDSQHLEAWLRRYQQFQGDDGLQEDGSMAPGSLLDEFVRDTFARVAILNRLVADFPDHIATAAWDLPAWPILAYLHLDHRPPLAQLAERLDLGSSCSVITSETASFDPESPLVRYLLALIARLDSLRRHLGDHIYPTLGDEQTMLLEVWWFLPEEPPGESVIAPLRRARQFSDLNQATASQWAREVIVPLILATDALDYQHCADPALQTIARDPQVTDAPTFQACLLTAVDATLPQIVRPPDPADENDIINPNPQNPNEHP